MLSEDNEKRVTTDSIEPPKDGVLNARSSGGKSHELNGEHGSVTWNHEEGDLNPLYGHAVSEGYSQISWNLTDKTGAEIADQFDLTTETVDPRAIIKRVLTQSATGIFLLLIWSIALLQFIVFPLLFDITNPLDSALWLATFTVQPDQLSYIWTYLTSVFSHGGFIHLFVNTIVLASFGFVVEKFLGTKRYIAFFLLTGILASVAQALVFNHIGTFVPILGASGAISALIGAFAIVQPKAKVYLFFILKMDMWKAVVIFLFGTMGLLLYAGFGAFGFGHTAHLVGLVLGLGYGTHRAYKDPQIKPFKNNFDR